MSRSIAATVAPFVIAIATVPAIACGGDAPPRRPPPTPRRRPRRPPRLASPRRPLTRQPRARSVSRTIVKACGINEPDAYFAFDSANLRPDDVRVLGQVATCFTSGPLKGRVLKMVGHADPRGDSDYNMTLGQSRADAVASYMRGKGMDKSKSESTSRGAMDATGSDEPSWARDRRVDMLLGQ